MLSITTGFVAPRVHTPELSNPMRREAHDDPHALRDVNRGTSHPPFADDFASRIQQVRQACQHAAAPFMPNVEPRHGAIKRHVALSLMRAMNQLTCLDTKKIAPIVNTPDKQMLTRFALDSCASHCNALMALMDGVLSQGNGLIDSTPLQDRLDRASASLATLGDMVDQIDKATPGSRTPFSYGLGATAGFAAIFSLYYLWSAQQDFSTIGNDGNASVSTAYTYNDAAKNLLVGIGCGVAAVSAALLMRYDCLHRPHGSRHLISLSNHLANAKIALDLVRQNLDDADLLDAMCREHELRGLPTL